MITANISKAKNELSRYLDAVRAGETVLITDRDRPIARITPLPPGAAEADNARLEKLEAAGLIRRPIDEPSKWIAELAHPTGSVVGSVDALIDERASGR